MPNIIIESPNKKHKAIITESGEIRFGPVLYSLIIDETSFGERCFGKDCLWSPDSRYFAIQEFDRNEYKYGPKTSLVLMAIEENKECLLSKADQGFIIPKYYENDSIVYEKQYHAKGLTKEFEINYLKLDRWRNIGNTA